MTEQDKKYVIQVLEYALHKCINVNGHAESHFNTLANAIEVVKNCSIPDVSKRVFVVEILEKEKGWNAISIDLETYEEALSFFNENRKDYSHGEIRIVQVQVC